MAIGKARSKSLVADTEGIVYVEVLLAFIPVFTLFLGMLQASLMYGANLVVTSSANRAARSAAVVLDAPESDFNNDERMLLDYGEAGSGTQAICMLLQMADVPCSFVGGSGNARLSAIRAAASMPLLGVSPSTGQLANERQVLRAVGEDPMSSRTVAGFIYNQTAVSVTFPEHTEARFSVGKNENLLVRVTYLFHCGVPIAARYMCDDAPSIASGIAYQARMEYGRMVMNGHYTVEQLQQQQANIDHAEARIAQTRGRLDDLAKSARPVGLAALAFSGARFHVLQAQSRLTVHGAGYEYTAP